MKNDLCLVPGAIDQYIPRSTFELLYPGETPTATMPGMAMTYPKLRRRVIKPLDPLKVERKITSFVLDTDTQGSYFEARASVDAKQPFSHDSADWLVTKIVMTAESKIEVYGHPFDDSDFEWVEQA